MGFRTEHNAICDRCGFNVVTREGASVPLGWHWFSHCSDHDRQHCLQWCLICPSCVDGANVWFDMASDKAAE